MNTPETLVGDAENVTQLPALVASIPNTVQAQVEVQSASQCPDSEIMNLVQSLEAQPIDTKRTFPKFLLLSLSKSVGNGCRKLIIFHASQLTRALTFSTISPCSLKILCTIRALFLKLKVTSNTL